MILGPAAPHCHPKPDEEVLMRIALPLESYQVLELIQHEKHTGPRVNPTITACEM